MLIHFPPLNSGQPLYSGQISWSQCVLYKEAPLYIHKCIDSCMYICMCAYFHLTILPIGDSCSERRQTGDSTSSETERSQNSGLAFLHCNGLQHTRHNSGGGRGRKCLKRSSPHHSFPCICSNTHLDYCYCFLHFAFAVCTYDCCDFKKETVSVLCSTHIKRYFISIVTHTFTNIARFIVLCSL